MAPDHSLRRRQGAEGLANLPQGKEHQQPDERTEGRPEDGAAQQKKCEQVDAGRTGDEQAVCRTRMVEQILVRSSPMACPESARWPMRDWVQNQAASPKTTKIKRNHHGAAPTTGVGWVSGFGLFMVNPP
jgi:hypothetical protein